MTAAEGKAVGYLGFVKWKLTAFIQMMRPHFIIASAMLFLIGVLAGVGDGKIFWSDPDLWVATASVVLLQLSVGLVNEYADWRGDRFSRRTFFAGGSGVIATGRASPGAAVSMGVIFGAMSIWMAYFITSERGLDLFMPIVAAGLVLGWAYSLRPVRLVSTGFGEVVSAAMMGFLTPILGFYLVAGELKIVWEVCLPLFLFSLATLIAVEYPDRQADIRSGKRNLTYRLGIKRAAIVQGAASFTGYALIIIFIATGALGLVVGLVLVMLPFVWAAVTVMSMSKHYDFHQAGIATAAVMYTLVLLMALMLLNYLL